MCFVHCQGRLTLVWATLYGTGQRFSSPHHPFMVRCSTTIRKGADFRRTDFAPAYRAANRPRKNCDEVGMHNMALTFLPVLALRSHSARTSVRCRGSRVPERRANSCPASTRCSEMKPGTFVELASAAYCGFAVRAFPMGTTAIWKNQNSRLWTAGFVRRMFFAATPRGTSATAADRADRKMASADNRAGTYSGSAKDIMVDPAAIDMNCLPPTVYVIGEVLIVAFSGIRHRDLPSRSSAATK